MLQKDPGVERVVRFVGFFASQLPDGCKEEALIFCEGLLAWLLGLAPAKDKTVRTRACQLLREIISALPEDAGLDEVRTPCRQYFQPALTQVGAAKHRCTVAACTWPMRRRLLVLRTTLHSTRR